MSVPVIVTLPVASNCTVMFLHTATGGFSSITVTTATQELVLPQLSVTNKVTLLSPKLAVVKLLGNTVIAAIPQLSVEPPSTFVGVILASPLLSTLTV